MKIAIASGKGGTGKTTLSVNLAFALDTEVQLVDCDVEEPNGRLFLEAVEIQEKIVHIAIPQVDEEKCTACNECGRFCEFNAIKLFGKKPMVFAEMCHGCGGCSRVCPEQAITEVDKRIGTIKTFRSGDITLLQGCIDVGVAMAPPLINALKKKIVNKGTVILDAPPGTTCPVIATLAEVDFVILVTEPTAFGLNDLILAVDMVRELGLPFGVVINRSGVGDRRVHDYCAQEKIRILLEIPNDRRIAEAYSRGQLIVTALPEYRKSFADLPAKIDEVMVEKKGVEQ